MPAHSAGGKGDTMAKKTTTESGAPQFAADTSRRTPVQWAKALAALLAGLTIAHLGVTLFLLSELGSDPFTVMIQGLARTAGLTVGTVHVMVLCLLMAVMALGTRGYVKPGTVVCAFLGGPIIDLFTWLLGRWISAASPLPVRCVSMVAGCVILAAGMSLVINSNAGTGPNDLVAIILSDKLGRFQFRWVRMACDLFFLAAGFLLGGTVGAGTLVAALLTGPVVQFWLPRTAPVTRWIDGPGD